MPKKIAYGTVFTSEIFVPFVVVNILLIIDQFFIYGR